jgi:hypothetical protein
MMVRMPASVAAPIAEQWFEHKRKFRHQPLIAFSPSAARMTVIGRQPDRR